MRATNTSSSVISRLLVGNESSLNEAIVMGDLGKAAEIANTALQAISQDPTVNENEKTKVKIS